jgi:hypothetical protein
MEPFDRNPIGFEYCCRHAAVDHVFASVNRGGSVGDEEGDQFSESDGPINWRREGQGADRVRSRAARIGRKTLPAGDLGSSGTNRTSRRRL